MTLIPWKTLGVAPVLCELGSSYCSIPQNSTIRQLVRPFSITCMGEVPVPEYYNYLTQGATNNNISSSTTTSSNNSSVGVTTRFSDTLQTYVFEQPVCICNQRFGLTGEKCERSTFSIVLVFALILCAAFVLALFLRTLRALRGATIRGTSKSERIVQNDRNKHSMWLWASIQLAMQLIWLCCMITFLMVPAIYNDTLTSVSLAASVGTYFAFMCKVLLHLMAMVKKDAELVGDRNLIPVLQVAATYFRLLPPIVFLTLTVGLLARSYISAAVLFAVYSGASLVAILSVCAGLGYTTSVLRRRALMLAELGPDQNTVTAVRAIKPTRRVRMCVTFCCCICIYIYA
jgi:hypothetical protein